MKFGPQSQCLGCVGLWQEHPAKSASAWWNKTMCNVSLKYSITWGETKGLQNHVDGVISRDAQFTWSHKESEKCCEWFHHVNGLLSWRRKGTTCSKHQKRWKQYSFFLNESPAKCSSEFQPALPAAILKALRKACGMRNRSGNLLRLFKVNPSNLTSDDSWLILIENITWAMDGKMGNL